MIVEEMEKVIKLFLFFIFNIYIFGKYLNTDYFYPK
jgi:hypothetical protein